MQTMQVRKVWELLVKQHRGYEDCREDGQWGFVRKKEGLASRLPGMARLKRAVLPRARE